MSAEPSQTQVRTALHPSIHPSANKSDEIQQDLRQNLAVIFGIALSSDNEPAPCLMACHALCACTSFVYFLPLLASLLSWLMLQPANGSAVPSPERVCSISCVAPRPRRVGLGDMWLGSWGGIGVLVLGLGDAGI